MKRMFILVLLLLFSFSTISFATNGTRLIGFGTKMNGRGGTGIGVFDSPSLMMTNPAGLAFVQGNALGLNVAALAPITGFKNNLNDKTGERNYYPVGGLGYAGQCPKIKNFARGIGIFTQGGMGADYELRHALYRDTEGNFLPQTYHSKFAVMQAGPSFAYRLTPKFAVGTSLHLMYGQLEFEMPYSLSPSIMKGIADPEHGVTFGQMFTGAPLNYDEVTSSAKMEDLSAWGFGGKLALAYKANDQLTFGLNYTSPTPMTFKNGTAKLDMTAQFNAAYATQVGAYMQQHQVSQDSAMHAIGAQYAALGIHASDGFKADYDLEAKLTNPQSLGFGIGCKATPKLNLALDVEWINWKNAFDKMKLTLKGGENPNINRMMGSPDIKVDFPLEWKDAVMVRVGGEYRVSSKTTLRLGYAHGTNPVPTSTIFSIFPAIVEHHLTCGASYDFSPAFSLHAAYEFALKNSLTADNPSKIAHEYDDSESNLYGMFFNVGAAWKIN